MAIEIGIVNVHYIDTPGFTVQRFVEAIMEDPDLTSLDNDDDEHSTDVWGTSWEGNAIYEFTREGLSHKADAWASHEGLSETDRVVLYTWVDGLPYKKDGNIMLHLSN